MARGQKGTGNPAKIRVGYMIYKLSIDDQSPATASLEIIDMVRSAEMALELVDENDGAKYHRFSMN